MHRTPDERSPLSSAAEEEVLRLRKSLSEALQAAQTAMRDTTRLTRLFTILSEPAPLELMLDNVLSTLSELFVADIVALVDPAGTGTFAPLAAVGLPEEMLQLPLSDDDDGHAAVVMTTQSPIHHTRIAQDGSTPSQLRELGSEVALWVPVIDSHCARGTLILARCRPEPFSRSDIDLLSSMAYRIGLALEQAQRSAQLTQIVQADREIGRRIDESEVCQEAVRILPGVLWADAALLVLVEPGKQPLCVARTGIDDSWDSTWCRLAAWLLTESSLAEGQPYSTLDLRQTADAYALELSADHPGRALLAVPVLREGRIRGLLLAMRFSKSLFTPDTLQMAMLYAGQVSAAMESARLYRVLRDELAERMRTEQELRESEERFKLAVMGGDLGTWDWNIATGEVRFNERWAEMLGYSLEEVEPYISSWEQLIHKEDLLETTRSLNAHLEGATPYFEIEHRLRNRAGRWIWVLNKGKVTHRDGAGRPLRVVGTQLDIHEARQIQAERLSMEQQKQQIWRAESLSRMAGGIAHHFNNQLMAVMGSLEMALLELPPEDRLHLPMSRALVASGRAAEISRLMLSYLGQTRTAKRPLELVETVRDALPLLTTSLPPNVHLTVEFPSVKLPILGDGVQLKQILSNLVANAMEAVGEKNGQIKLTLGRMCPSDLKSFVCFPPDWAPESPPLGSIAVSDDGCGVDEADIQKIFDPFYSTKFAGRGLGLSVVLGLLRAHEAAIAVRSRLGHGSTFVLLFPLSTLEALPPSPEEARVRKRALDTGPVLVVDDEPMIRLVAAAQLEQLGYKALEACDGVEALELFRGSQDVIRLVLLDISMPRMGGWETLTALRSIRPDVPVVMASGYDEAQAMSGEHPELPHAFLHKPYALHELKEALETALTSCPLS